MPDPAPLRRKYEPRADGAAQGASLLSNDGRPRIAYAELHAKTNFSFLEGASHPDELVTRAAELGYAALAITDRNSLAGVVRAHVTAKDVGLKLLIGAEINPLDAPPVVLLAMNRAGYGQLARLLTCGRRRATKGECRLVFDDLAAHQAGLLAAVISPREPEETASNKRTPDDELADESFPRRVDLPAWLWSGEVRREHAKWLSRYRELFGDRCYALAEMHYGPDDRNQLEALIALARRARVPLVAAGDVYYHVRERMALQHVLAAIRHQTTVAQAGRHLLPHAERHLKSPEEIAARFAWARDAVERTVEVAGRCNFSLDELRYEYPEELCPPGTTPREHLAQLTWAGAARRYPAGVPDKVRSLLEHELKLIEDLRYEPYFLTVWDLVRFARERDILCQGRGSAANSAVCYALGVTAVDPEQIDVLFERFVSRERDEAPDIDVDFEHERREEVLQYLYDKYGRDRAGITAEVITYRPRSAVRDVAKALGLSLERIDILSQALDSYRHEANLNARCREAGLDPDSAVIVQLVELVDQLVGFPRHLSQHVGGMVITQGSLSELVPIENAAMPQRTVVQWDKDDLDALGILKVDCLALGMLTAIRKCFDLVQKHTGRSLTLANIPPDDGAVYDMIDRADTVGVFQIESRAQMSMLPRLQPRTFYDLVIEVAIVRPGPIQGKMVHPYLRRRAGLEEVSYPSEAIRDVLKKTLGVPIFQEQAMRLAVVAAGFTPGEADQLRRAMGAWRRTGVIEQFRQKLISGMLERGLTPDFAERVFLQIRGFGEYGFPESHAASFALLVYVSAWLKHYYPAAFCAALLNSQPMGFYAPAQLVRDAREHDVEVRPADVNYSTWDATLEPAANDAKRNDAEKADTENIAGARPANAWALRLGLRQISGLGEAQAAQITAARGQGPFRTVEEFARRARLGRPVVVRLARADALGSLAADRRAGLWHALVEQSQRLPLFDQVEQIDQADRAEAGSAAVTLPPLTPAQQIVADYQTVGMSLRAHPMSLLREQLDAIGVVRAAELAHLPTNRLVRVAGLVLMRQRPSTAKGVTFVTLEDETGIANLIVRQQVWERHHRTARSAGVMLASGRLERVGTVIHILAERLSNLTGKLAGLNSKSRDFR